MNEQNSRPTAAVPSHVGVVGLGAMGGGMAWRLLERGIRVTVYNRTAEKAAPFAEAGAEVAATPAEVAAVADVVVLSLADQNAVDDVLFGSGRMFAALRPGTVVLDTSTVAPAFARERAERLKQAGLGSLDACIIGNAYHARSGELRFFVGGDAGVLRRVTPLLDQLGKDVTHVGPDGSGSSMKLVLNMLMGIEMQALAEAIVLGDRLGLTREAIVTAITNSGFSSPVMKMKAAVMHRRAFSRADFRLALMRKDLGLVRGEAQRLAVPMAVAEATYSVLTAAMQQGLGDLDCAAVLVETERTAGITPRGEDQSRARVVTGSAPAAR